MSVHDEAWFNRPNEFKENCLKASAKFPKSHGSRPPCDAATLSTSSIDRNQQTDQAMNTPDTNTPAANDRSTSVSDPRARLFDLHHQLTNKAFAIMRAKNHDYANGSNPYANFMRGEHFGLGTAEEGILLRMLDKMSRLATFTKKGELNVAGESVEDSILDIMNYGVLYLGVIQERNRGNLPSLNHD